VEYINIKREIQGWKKFFLFLDYDGTLVPIAPTPKEAKPTGEILKVLKSLVKLDGIKLAIVSGRALKELEELIPLEGISLVGVHGAHIKMPNGEQISLVNEKVIKPIIRETKEKVKKILISRTGFILEDKELSLALHFRLASDEESIKIINEFQNLADAIFYGSILEFVHGKRVIELKPRGIGKGRAVDFLLKKQCEPQMLPIYIGDDKTDEDAFKMLKGNGLTILVSEVPEKTHAKYRLRDPNEVLTLLKLIREEIRYGTNRSEDTAKELK